MTKDEKDIILKMLIEEKNYYEGECRRRMAEEYGKMKGADYMIQRFNDNFKTEESEDKKCYLKRGVFQSV